MDFLKNNRVIIVLSIAAFAASFAYSLYFRITPLVDARAYDNIGWNLAQGNGYREFLDGPIENDNSIIRVGPGYEFFLAAIYWLFGHHYWIIWFLQALMHACSVFLIYLIARNIFKEEFYYTALTASFLIGFSPDLITMSAMLMTETVAIFLGTLSAYLFFRYFDSKSLFILALLSLVLGTAIMVRTPLAFLGIPIGVYLLLYKRWLHALILVAIIVCMFIPWILRNNNVYHEFIPTNAAAGYNLIVGNHVGASGEQEPYPKLDEYVKQYGYIASNDMAVAEAKQFIFAHPFEYIKLTLLRVSVYFSFARPTGFWFHLSGISKVITLILSAIYSVILFTLGFLGISKIKHLQQESRIKSWLLLAMFIAMPLAIVGIIVETRYRFLSYPFLALFAGYGTRELQKEKSCRICFVVIFFLLFSNSVFDILRNFSRIIERLHGL